MNSNHAVLMNIETGCDSSWVIQYSSVLIILLSYDIFHEYSSLLINITGYDIVHEYSSLLINITGYDIVH